MNDNKPNNGHTEKSNKCDTCKIQNCERKCEDYKNLRDNKITVIGDSWLRLLILPEVTEENRKRKYQASLYSSGASRVFDMICAATDIDTDNTKNPLVGHLYVPQCPQEQLLAASSMKEGEPDKEDKDFFDNLRHIGYSDNNNNNKVYQMNPLWGAEQLPGLAPSYYDNGRNNGAIGINKYWVIVDDCMFSRDSTVYFNDRQELYFDLYHKFREELEKSESAPWILWAPRCFGNETLRDYNKVWEEQWLRNNDESKKDLNKSIKKQTIVFLSVEALTEAGIGQRGDGSIEECLAGLLDAIERNPEMQRLKGCAAIVVENGVDSAFLIQLDEQGKVSHCQSFFRTVRHCKAYWQGVAFVREGLILASCLNALIQTEEDTDKDVVKRLEPGIKDSLWRMLLQFHIGLPQPVSKEDATNGKCNDKISLMKYFKKIYALLSPDDERILIVDMLEQYRKVAPQQELDETKDMIKKIEQMVCGKNDCIKQCCKLIENSYKEIKEKNTHAGSDKTGNNSTENRYNILKDCIKNCYGIIKDYGIEIKEQADSNEIEKVVKFFKKNRVHEVKLIDGKNKSYENNKSSATYLSYILRFPYQQSQSSVLAPWLLEKQWDQIEKPEQREDFLNDIVKYGLTTLSKQGRIQFPVAHFGKMRVVDPDEISMYRRIQNLMRKYLEDNSGVSKPLGLAAFGPPGTGKSFTIEQVAQTIQKDIKLIKCNLSQFTTTDDLYKKLLEARDYHSKGQCPIIFLDEFDSPVDGHDFGWFKHLLALLQDREFFYQGSVFHIPKAFVICAGGLNRSFQEFEWKSRNPAFRYAKIPDLISRLRGNVNIKGPNPYFPYPSNNDFSEKESDKPFKIPALEDYDHFLKVATLTQELRVGDLAKHDPLYKIRRAVSLRSLLKAKMPFIYNESHELAVDPKVLKALLDIPEYKYGIRSIEAIIEMSVSVYRSSRRFISAMIPPPEQLNMHVDAEEFYNIMRQYPKNDER